MNEHQDRPGADAASPPAGAGPSPGSTRIPLPDPTAAPDVTATPDATATPDPAVAPDPAVVPDPAAADRELVESAAPVDPPTAVLGGGAEAPAADAPTADPDVAPSCSAAPGGSAGLGGSAEPGWPAAPVGSAEPGWPAAPVGPAEPGWPGAPGGSGALGDPGVPGDTGVPGGLGVPGGPGAAGGPAEPGAGYGPAGASGGGGFGWRPGGATAAGSGGWGAGGSYSGARLRRSRSKVVAGVARGLGDYTGVDPVLFRVIFAVLALFGGAGVLLYVVGWLFLPAEDEEVSPAESLIGRGSGRASDAVKAVLLVVAGLFLAGVLARGDAGDVLLLLVVAGGAVFLARNLADRRGGGPPQPVGSPPPPAAYQPYDQPAAFDPRPSGTATATAVAAPPAPPMAPVPPVRPPAHRRQRSALGALTLSLLLVVLGVAAAVESADAADLHPRDFLALAVGTLGVGLLVGAWVGRARWLSWLGLPLLLALIVAGSSDLSVQGGTGDREYAPTTLSEVEAEYRVGIGVLRIDLSAVDFSERPTRIKASVGIGNVEVIVPRNADVRVDGRAGAGETQLFEQREGGTSVSRQVTSYGSSDDPTIDLELDLDINIGNVEVTRAQA